MDDPLYAMLFAEDLVAYVLYKYKINWDPQQGIRRFRTEIGKTRFSKEVGEAVYLAAEYYKTDIWNNYNVLKSRCSPLTDIYRKEAAITTIMNFPRGYDPVRYILLSASFAGLAAYFFKEDPKIADVSAQLLAYIINFYILHRAFDPKTRYFELAYESQKFRRKFLDNFENSEHIRAFRDGLIDDSSVPPHPASEEEVSRKSDIWNKRAAMFLFTKTTEMSNSEAAEVSKIESETADQFEDANDQVVDEEGSAEENDKSKKISKKTKKKNKKKKK